MRVIISQLVTSQILEFRALEDRRAKKINQIKQIKPIFLTEDRTSFITGN